MDDLITPSKSEKENILQLKEVLKVAKENGLIIKFEKCKFFKRKTEFLGHIIEAGSIKPNM